MFVRINYSSSSMTSARYISSVNEIARSEQKARARRDLALFFFFLLLFSSLCYWLIIVKQNALSMSFLMWMPGLAALVSRLVLREPFSTTSHRLGGWRWFRALGIALFAPFVIGLLAYGLAWQLGTASLTDFHLSATLASFLPWIGSNPSLPAMSGFVCFVVCAEIIGATGEELGWRGYMLTRLIDAEVPQPVLVSGLIWSLWHWPLILFSPATNGLPQLVTACIFLVTITSLGYVSAHLRLTTGSLWPSILLHAAWNGIILELFNAFTKGADTSIWTGEAGLLVAFMSMLVAFIITHAGLQTKSAKLATLKRSGWNKEPCNTSVLFLRSR
jgi:membrane protease YdiL (CAAX protease family)